MPSHYNFPAICLSANKEPCLIRLRLGEQQFLQNNLGTGSNPHLTITLSKNGPGWNPYTIDYGAMGEIPTPKTNDPDWSSWNIYDENQNYYGTFTLSKKEVSDTEYTLAYSANGSAYSLEGINFPFDEATQTYGISVNNIIQPTPGDGPFPNTPRATPACYNNTTLPITLATIGKDIVADRRPIKLKGVVRCSLEWNQKGQYLSPEDIAEMAKQGATTIRIPLNQNSWFSSADADTKGSYKQIIDAMIAEATKHGMAVILDLHRTKDGQQSSMANKESLIFWQQVAEAYKAFGTVIFELFNEPVGIDQNTWLNGNNAEYVGMQQLYDAVRGTGAQNPVIVNGLDFGYDLSFVNDTFCVKGQNIIYGTHPYNEKGLPGYSGQGGDITHCLAGIYGKYPVIATEFGDNIADDYQSDAWKANYNYYVGAGNTFDQLGIHYTGFAWWIQPGQPQFPVLIDGDWSNPKPAWGGEFVFANMQRSPGTNFFNLPAPEQTVNQASARFQPTYHPPIRLNPVSTKKPEPSRSFWARLFHCCVPPGTRPENNGQTDQHQPPTISAR